MSIWVGILAEIYQRKPPKESMFVQHAAGKSGSFQEEMFREGAKTFVRNCFVRGNQAGGLKNMGTKYLCSLKLKSAGKTEIIYNFLQFSAGHLLWTFSRHSNFRVCFSQEEAGRKCPTPYWSLRLKLVSKCLPVASTAPTASIWEKMLDTCLQVASNPKPIGLFSAACAVAAGIDRSFLTEFGSSDLADEKR